MTILSFENVFASYGPYRALNGLNLSVNAGESVAVLGRNGVGKSTLVRVASGLVPFTSGTLEVLGERSTKFRTFALAQRGVVHLPEGAGLFSELSIEENLVLRVGGATRNVRRERFERALDGIGPLRERRKTKAGLLSGGQQRLVAVSAALAAEPKLLLADEPALGLSPAASDDIYESLEEFRSSDAALVIVETRLGRIENLCSRSVVMNGGTSIYDGPTSDVRQVLLDQLHQTPTIN